ncbi:MAG: hypothetical protein HY062_07640 [Bacteroidetes bacterium]|nr:hypothetical protein [Bacteroidota bacterium]
MQDLTNTSDTKYSLTALLIAILAIGYLVFSAIPSNVFAYDVLGYYLYLPAGFKYNDIALKNYDQLQSILSTYHTSDGFYQAFRIENGNWVMKYPMGMAILYYPFYVIGDKMAHVLGYPEDGFSLPYQLSVLYGCFVYTVIGLIAFRKVLLHFFTDKVAAVTLLLIVFGTNYLLHVSIHAQPAMVHNVVFSLHALTIYFTIKWYKEFKVKYIVALGITIGLAAISRPPEILIVLVPLFYNVFSFQSLKQKAMLLYNYRVQVLAFVCIVFVIVSYQLVYWKIITGHFLFDSYGDHLNEGFNFKHPYILEFLFSFRKGWFIYTPMMVFAIVGFYYFYKASKPWFLACCIYFGLNFYVMSSWSCWWYGISFSSRAIIPAYIILAIPFGFLLNKVVSSKAKFVLVPVFVLLVFLNIFQSWQIKHGILEGSRMTKAYYKSVFLQTSDVTDEQRKLLLIDKYSSVGAFNFDEKNLSKYKLIFSKEENFDSKSKEEKNIVDSLSFSKNQCLLTNTNVPFAADLRAVYKDISQKSYLIVKISAQLFTRENPNDVDGRLVLNMLHKEKSYNFKCLHTKTANLKQGEWNKVTFYYMTPDFWDRNDIIQGYFWNTSDKNMFVDDIKVEAYEPIEDETVF